MPKRARIRLFRDHQLASIPPPQPSNSKDRIHVSISKKLSDVHRHDARPGIPNPPVILGKTSIGAPHRTIPVMPFFTFR